MSVSGFRKVHIRRQRFGIVHSSLRTRCCRQGRCIECRIAVGTFSENECCVKLDAFIGILSTTMRFTLRIIQSPYELTLSVFLTVKNIHRIFKSLICNWYFGLFIIEWE